MKISELKKLNIDDIDLILNDQIDMYTQEEINELREWRLYLIEQAKRENEEVRKTRLKTVKCPKCDGVNDSESSSCVFCNYRFRESDYYAKEEFRRDDTADVSVGSPIGALLGGFAFVGGGVAAIVYGNNLNNSVEAQWDAFWNNGNTDPGTAWIIVGVAVGVIGLLMLVSALFSKD